MKTGADLVKNTYGPRKLGQAEYDRQKAANQGMVSSSGVRYGSRKRSAPPQAAPAVPEPGPASQATPEPPAANPFIPSGDADASGRTTVAELERKLAEDPSLLDQAISAEFRDGTPRKGAVKILLGLEQAKAEPRPTMLKILKGHA